jgi:hypothetical protein
MRTAKLFLFVTVSYLAGWVTADWIVPHVLASRGESLYAADSSGASPTTFAQGTP